MSEEQVHEHVRTALRDILINDDEDWNMSDIARAEMFTEHDGLSVTQTNSPLQLWLIQIAEECARTFLNAFESMRADGTWFREDPIDAWIKHFEDATAFNHPGKAVVWFTWDLMVPDRFPQERQVELIKRALMLFKACRDALMNVEEHKPFADVLNTCLAKLLADLDDVDPNPQTQYLRAQGFPAKILRPARPTLD